MNNPQLYSKVNDVQRRDVYQLLAQFNDKIKWRNDGTESVLDIGCGSGDVTSNIIGSIMPKQYKYLKGIDKSVEMVQHANAKYKSPKVSFEQWDVTGEVDTEISEQYDRVFSFYVLHWVQNQKLAFQNIYNLLKPGGDCLVMFLADHIFFSIIKLQSVNPKYGDIFKKVPYPMSPYRNKTNADLILKEIVESIGFKDVIVQVEDKSYTFYGADNFKGFVKAVHPPAALLTGDLQKEMLQDFCTACSKNSVDTANEFSTPYKLITFYGKKNIKIIS